MKEMQEFEQVERFDINQPYGYISVIVNAEDYDALLAYAKELQKENGKLLNDASVWRNRAIGAEEELNGSSRLDLRTGFER